MSNEALTRVSLLIRLKDQADADAWSKFVEIYAPLILAFARRCHLQDSDAADLVQEVMCEVSRSIGRFEYDPQVGKFRSWLYTIAKRTMTRLRKKQSNQPTGTGNTEVLLFLNSQADAHNDLQRYWDLEYKRKLIGWASDQVRGDFFETTWQAFWLFVVEERPVNEIADQLETSAGAVYVAKSRVMKRLAEKIRQIDEDF